MTPREIAAGLTEHERERLTGWQGPPGAAFNAVSAYLQKHGLLYADWNPTPLGLAVRAVLLEGE